MPELPQRLMLVSMTTHFFAFVQSVAFRGTGLAFARHHLAATFGLGARAFGAARACFLKTVSLIRL